MILRSEGNSASAERYRAFITSNPGWPSVNFLRRRGDSGTVGQQPRRQRRSQLVRKRAAVVGQGPLHAGACAVGARRPQRGAASRARRLAWRSDVEGHGDLCAGDARLAARRRPITRHGWIICSSPTTPRARCAPRSASARRRWRLQRRASPSTTRPATPRRCSTRCPRGAERRAYLSAASSTCAAPTRSPRPRS